MAIKPDGRYLDGTVGGGGHFKAIASRLDTRGVAIGLDRDPDAIAHAQQHVDGAGAHVILAAERFSRFAQVLRKHNIDALDGALLDLGVSSHQIDTPERGFRYQSDADLDMRMNPQDMTTAAEILHTSSVEELRRILSEFGEIRNPGRMAAVLHECAHHRELRTSGDLRKCLEAEYGPNLKFKVLAKIFQALRIAVNDELAELRAFLGTVGESLVCGGRLVVISYHSLEDRMVKNYIRENATAPDTHWGMRPRNISFQLKPINRKVIRPAADEVESNPRARSARLRAAERIL